VEESSEGEFNRTLVAISGTSASVLKESKQGILSSLLLGFFGILLFLFQFLQHSLMLNKFKLL
jgi:hypothetical protein